jgi:hypothetical protein
MMSAVLLSAGGIDRYRRAPKCVVRPAHAAARTRFPVLLNCHRYFSLSSSLSSVDRTLKGLSLCVSLT